jgi:hypothetical protein
VSRCAQHFDFEAANIDFLIIAKTVFAVLEWQTFSVANLSFCHVLEFKRTYDVVFVSVGLKNVLDFCAFFLSQARVDFAVTSWVDNDRFAFVGQVVAVVG